MLPADNDPSTARVALLHAHLARVDRARKLGFAAAPFDGDNPVPCLLLVAPALKLLEHGLELKTIDDQAAQRWFLLFRANIRRALFPVSMPPLVHRAAPLIPDIDPLVLSTLNATSGLLARGLMDDTRRLGLKSRQRFEFALDCAGEAPLDVFSRCDQLNTTVRRCVWQYATIAGKAYH